MRFPIPFYGSSSLARCGWRDLQSGKLAAPETLVTSVTYHVAITPISTTDTWVCLFCGYVFQGYFFTETKGKPSILTQPAPHHALRTNALGGALLLRLPEANGAAAQGGHG